MRILFVGGTRFIGLNALLYLHRQGHEITVFNRGQTEADLPADVARIQGDRTELANYRDQFAKLQPDVVIHMMLIGGDDAKMVMDTFRGIAGRMIGISSIDVYLAYGRLHGTDPGEPVPTPVKETDPLRLTKYPYRAQFSDPEHPMYNYDKIHAEEQILGYDDLPGSVLRLPMVYGARDYQRRLYPYLKRMDDGRPYILLDERAAEWKACRGYVEDVGKAIALAATNEAADGRIYNVAEERALTEIEWIKAIADVVGWDGVVKTIPADQLPEAMHLETNGQNLDAATTRIREELGYSEDVPRDEAIRRTITWDRENPPEQLPDGAFDYEAEDAVLAQVNA